MYLAVFGPIIRLFDKAAARLLRRLGIEPIEELPEGATEEDLEQIIAESRAEGHLDPELSAAARPRPGLPPPDRRRGDGAPGRRAHRAGAGPGWPQMVALLDTGRSRFPVRAGNGVDEIVGVVGIADVLAVPPRRARHDAGRVHGGGRRCSCRPRCACPRCWTGCAAATGSWPAWSTSTAASPASSPSRTSPRSWSARSATRTTCPSRPRSARRTARGWCRPAGASTRSTDATGVELPEGDDYDTVSGLVMSRAGPGGRGRRLVSLPSGASLYGALASTGTCRGRTALPADQPVVTAVSTTWAVICSVLLLAGNAFFVAAEFALVASKRYRLEHAAAEGSRAAKAALDGSRELSLMLAGAQLGITLCSLGLGALAEPAIEHLLHPLLSRASACRSVPSDVDRASCSRWSSSRSCTW